VQCGLPDDPERWRAYLGIDEDLDESAEVVFYSPPCAERMISLSRSVTPLSKLYGILVLIFVAAVVLWLLRDSVGTWAADWTPNVGVGALTILFTVAFVDRIFRCTGEEGLPRSS
jgi:hypothetical protein